MINLCTTALDQCTEYWHWWNFSDWLIFEGKNVFFLKNFVMWEVKEGIELKHCNLWGWCQNNGPIGGLLTLKEFFRLDHFWGKNSFFEKNFVVGWFWRRDWATAFKLGGMIRYIWGSGLLKKNSRLSDFCENCGHFSKIRLYNFFKNTVSGINSYIIGLALDL